MGWKLSVISLLNILKITKNDDVFLLTDVGIYYMKYALGSWHNNIVHNISITWQKTDYTEWHHNYTFVFLKLLFRPLRFRRESRLKIFRCLDEPAASKQIIFEGNLKINLNTNNKLLFWNMCKHSELGDSSHTMIDVIYTWPARNTTASALFFY